MQDVPKIALRRLQDAELSAVHPDADLLTAFAERSLAELERDRVMMHLATCGDCRNVVALALPATEELAMTAVSSRTTNVWFSWPVLRWGLVTAGILVVMSVGVVQYKQAHEKNNSGGEVTLTARNAAPVERQAAFPSAPETKAAVSMQPSVERLKQGNLGAQPTGGLTRTPGAISSLSQSVHGAASAKNRISMAPSGQRLAVPSSPLPASSQMVEVQSEAGSAGAARKGVSDQLIASNVQAVQPQSVIQGDVVKAKPAARATSSVVIDAASSSLQKDMSVMQPTPRWTISSSGTLQRSFDEGNTWEDVNVTATAGASKLATAEAEPYQRRAKDNLGAPSSGLVFRAVAALGNEVWAGGSGGALYHSGDSGARWMRVVPSSAGDALSGDISRIEFSDPQHGTVATSTSEVWLTTDGGLTWHRQQ